MEDETDPTTEEHRELGSEIGLNSLAAHMYRGEMDRVTQWRARLDNTTNFAVTVIGAVLAYAFSGQGAGHTVVLVGMMIGVVFLSIEARRYRRYDVWRSRARSIQENLFANALDPSQGVEQRNWREQLSHAYRDPPQTMTYHTAVAHRLRRVYLPLLLGLGVIWLFHLTAYGSGEPIARASIEGVPGPYVVGAVAAFYVGLFALAFVPAPEEEIGSADLGDIEDRR